MFLVKGKVSIIRKGKFSFRKQHYGNMISVFLVRTKSPFNCLREIFILETLDVGIGDFRQPSFPCQLTNNSRDTRRSISTLTRCDIFTKQLVRHYYIVTSKCCIRLKIIVSLLYHIQHDTIMPIQKYEVSLSAEERKQLTKIVKSGNMPARTILRANILLAVDRNGKQPMTVQEAAIAFNTSATTVQNVRTRYGENGLDATIQRKKRKTPPVEAKVTGDVEAHIIALACGDPPKGYAKWTLRLLADRSVKLGYIESISHTQVGRILKKTSTSLI